MVINIKFDIHAYVEERLCDDCFEDTPYYGIHGPEVMLPLKQKQNYICSFQYDDTTSIGNVIDFIKEKIWGNAEYDVPAPISYSFLSNGERYYVADKNISFSGLLNAYLDPNNSGTVTACVLISCDAGDIAAEESLRFSVRSHEAGSHHEPHIHVRDTGRNYEASIRISDGEVIAGKLPAKLAKLAKHKILSEQEYFYRCWNTMTDGLKIDINHHFGYIGY